MTTTRANIGISISVGNAAVQTIDDVAAILAEASRDLLTDRASIRALDDRSMPLADANGNVVGWVQVTGFSVEADDLSVGDRVRILAGGSLGTVEDVDDNGATIVEDDGDTAWLFASDFARIDSEAGDQ